MIYYCVNHCIYGLFNDECNMLDKNKVKIKIIIKMKVKMKMKMKSLVV